MPLVSESFDYLPNIDTSPTNDELKTIQSTLLASLPADYTSTPHPSLPPAYQPHWPALLSKEHSYLASNPNPPNPTSNLPSNRRTRTSSPGIDTSRYDSHPTSTTTIADSIADRTTLQQAHTNLIYLHQRQTTLSLLEHHGKNSWLLHNDMLEHELAGLEQELALVKADTEVVDRERWESLQRVEGEFEVLGEAWRKGVSGVLETQVAAEDVRRAVMRGRRGG